MFFSKKKYKVELVSLHIPKTAGTSFRNILKSVYGDRAVVRLDINNRGVTRLNQVVYEENKAPSAKVLHGHFVYEDIVNRFDLPTGFKKITWLRHPVQRVVSNYYYLESRLKTLLNEEQKNLNILSKMQRSLLEYAGDEINRNRQSKFLKGIELKDFDFVGIQEDFNEDLVEIAKVLNWGEYPQPIHHNKTPTKRPPLDPEIRREIELLNQEDMNLYREALELRGKKVSKYA
jgi:hypothetical protein